MDTSLSNISEIAGLLPWNIIYFSNDHKLLHKTCMEIKCREGSGCYRNILSENGFYRNMLSGNKHNHATWRHSFSQFDMRVSKVDNVQMW